MAGKLCLLAKPCWFRVFQCGLICSNRQQAPFGWREMKFSFSQREMFVQHVSPANQRTGTPFKVVLRPFSTIRIRHYFFSPYVRIKILRAINGLSALHIFIGNICDLNGGRDPLPPSFYFGLYYANLLRFFFGYIWFGNFNVTPCVHISPGLWLTRLDRWLFERMDGRIFCSSVCLGGVLSCAFGECARMWKEQELILYLGLCRMLVDRAQGNFHH